MALYNKIVVITFRNISRHYLRSVKQFLKNDSQVCLQLLNEKNEFDNRFFDSDCRIKLLMYFYLNKKCVDEENQKVLEYTNQLLAFDYRRYQCDKSRK